jgi:hypothetical protein
MQWRPLEAVDLCIFFSILTLQGSSFSRSKVIHHIYLSFKLFSLTFIKDIFFKPFTASFKSLWSRTNLAVDLLVLCLTMPFTKTFQRLKILSVCSNLSEFKRASTPCFFSLLSLQCFRLEWRKKLLTVVMSIFFFFRETQNFFYQNRKIFPQAGASVILIG